MIRSIMGPLPRYHNGDMVPQDRRANPSGVSGQFKGPRENWISGNAGPEPHCQFPTYPRLGSTVSFVFSQRSPEANTQTPKSDPEKAHPKAESFRPQRSTVVRQRSLRPAEVAQSAIGVQ
jgi:hypothetical protein